MLLQPLVASFLNVQPIFSGQMIVIMRYQEGVVTTFTGIYKIMSIF